MLFAKDNELFFKNPKPINEECSKVVNLFLSFKYLKVKFKNDAEFHFRLVSMSDLTVNTELTCWKFFKKTY